MVLSPQYPNSFSALNNLYIGSLKCASGRFVSEMYISSGSTGFHTAGRLLFDFAALSQFLTDLIDDRETRSDRPSDLTLAMNSFSTVTPWCSLHWTVSHLHTPDGLCHPGSVILDDAALIRNSEISFSPFPSGQQEIRSLCSGSWKALWHWDPLHEIT